MSLKNAKRGYDLSAADMRRAGRAIDAQRPAASYCGSSTRIMAGGSATLETEADWFPAEVTGTVTGGYAAKEQIINHSGTLADKPDGRTASSTFPAVRVGSGSFSTGDKCLLRRARYAGGLYFEALPLYAGSGSITVKEVDGSPSYSSITDLRFDQDLGFVVTQPAAGAAKVSLALIAGTTTTGLSGTNVSSGSVVNVTGMSVSLPAAGTYILDARIRGYGKVTTLTSASAAATIFCHIAKSDDTVLSDYVCVLSVPVTGVEMYGFGSIRFVYTATGAVTVKVRAQSFGATWASSPGVPTAGEASSLSYLRIA